MKKVKKIIWLIVLCGLLMAPSISSFATVSGNDTNQTSANDNDKKDGKETLKRYRDKCIEKYGLTADMQTKVYEICESYGKMIDNATTQSIINNLVASAKSHMDEVAEGLPKSTQEFLGIADSVATPVATYGKPVSIILPIINLSNVNLTDLVVVPVTSTVVAEWPFNLDRVGYADTIADIPGLEDKEAAIANRRELTYSFTTRDDVLTGYYPLKFKVTYNRAGTIETTTLTTYVQTVGAPGSGTTGSTAEGESENSKPRVIVTGFKTQPEVIFAGNTFELTLYLENTSKRTAISNMEINLEAAKEGTDEKTTYSAFLPTSGSNTTYVDQIAAGGSKEIVIEMTAKADLIQKPYALNVKMNYEDNKFKPYESLASVSIPIRQLAKFDTSTPEVMPVSIPVGGQSNVMFSIYNTGKTTLYNVQVKYEGASLTGGDCFIGKIEPGATGNADSMITGAVPTTDDGKIKAIITYEDDAGNADTKELEMILMVTEEMPMDIMGPGGMGMEEEPKSNTGNIIAIVVTVVILLGIAGVVIFMKLKKKRRAAKELEEDLLHLDEDGTDQQ